MFKGAFREGVSQTAKEEQTTTEAFDLFTSWVYNKSKPSLGFGGVRSIIGHSSQESDDKVMVDFYILSDKDMLPNTVKIQLVQTVAIRGCYELNIFDKSRLYTYKHVPDPVVNETIKDLPEDDAMRKGVITRACKALLTDDDASS